MNECKISFGVRAKGPWLPDKTGYIAFGKDVTFDEIQLKLQYERMTADNVTGIERIEGGEVRLHFRRK